MNNSELWDSYNYYTGELTKYSRQLAFANAAICWFFKSPEVTFPSTVVISLALLVVYFASDILQFFISAHLLRWWTRREEKQKWEAEKTITGDYNKPWWLDIPAFFFFNLKIVSLFFSFIALGVEFIGRI